VNIEIEKIFKLIKKENVRGIASDSREVRDGYVFAALKGENFDGHNFVDDAIERGAVIVILEKDLYVKQGVKKIVVKDVKSVLGSISNEFYNSPFDDINTIGITGTNGKTTTAYLIEGIFKSAGLKTGFLGTINYRLGERILPAVNTTPPPPLIYKLGADMKTAGIDNCIMEVSSHALAQNRVSKVKFNFGIFTNLGRDHLDFHITVKDYFEKKLILFKMLDENAFAIVNRDDAYFKRIKAETKANLVSFGFSSKADIRVNKYNNKILEIVYPEGVIEIENKLIGKHNIYNILAAFSTAYLMKIDINKIKYALENPPYIPGRLEKIKWIDKDVDVYIDYAHTPDALKHVLKCLSDMKKKKLIVVFGCGGERDIGKRSKMGFVAWKYADFSFVTSDNPRKEEPNKIIKQTVKGFLFKNKLKTIIDRKQAIHEALSFAEKGDIILIAGKGHESYQTIGSLVLPFSDKDVVCELIKTVDKKDCIV
jgi:UDP-N-acetylmuramoyl-L-alanyl-D-glutamate--2,6-diaminopimelate ligase